MNHRFPVFAAMALSTTFIFASGPGANSHLLAQSPAKQASEIPTKKVDTGTEPSERDSEVSPELIKKLEKALTGSTWTGQFTVEGGGGPPKPESYAIETAVHQAGDDWVLTARIEYGDRDINFPVPVKILWAGRTPVITLDEVTIPPLGTFDARVLIRRGSYAGTWRHGKKGGHLFGKYKKAEEPKKAQ